MDRKEFIKKIGVGAAVTLTFGCIGGCTKMDNPPKPVNSLGSNVEIDIPTPGNNTGNGSAPKLDFTLDLSDPLFDPLETLGGYVVINNRYVIARAIDGNYVAATRLCSHEAFYEIEYHSTSNEWLCVEHGATFDLNGGGTTTYEPAKYSEKGLTVYNTDLNDQKLRVYES